MRSVVVLIKKNNMLPHVETDRIAKIFPRADVLSSKCGIAVWRKKYNECPTKKNLLPLQEIEESTDSSRGHCCGRTIIKRSNRINLMNQANICPYVN